MQDDFAPAAESGTEVELFFHGDMICLAGSGKKKRLSSIAMLRWKMRPSAAAT